MIEYFKYVIVVLVLLIFNKNKNMDKTKNNKVYIYAYAFSFIIILIFFSFLINKKNKVDDTKMEKEIVNVNNFINSWDYENAISALEEKWTGSLERAEKIKLLESYLNYWNYFHKEEDFSKKAIAVLDTMSDEYITFFYRWFAKEIIKDYTWALDQYNKWLVLTDLPDDKKAILLNQIWHLYDLKWDFDKVFSYYDEAYKLDNNNESALWNLWRYYARTGEYNKAKEFLNKALNLTANLPHKSEISFWLSSIELELNWLKPDIEKSIEYAKDAIEYYPNYAMWYFALARWLYMKNDLMYAKEIEENLNKSIKLNPDWYFAYELYAMQEYDKWNMEEFLNQLQKAESLIEKDMILMDNQRETEKIALNYKYYVLTEIQKNKWNINDVFNFLDKVTSSQLWINLLKSQVQRTDNGILGFLSWEEKFKYLIEKLSK